MKIDHAALYVNDLEGCREFFETYFGAVSNQLYHNRKTGFRSYFLSFDETARLEIMTREDLEDPEKTARRTGFIHLCFGVGSKEKVDELTETLRNAGYPVISGPRVTGDGYYESCIDGFEHNQIEITV